MKHHFLKRVVTLFLSVILLSSLIGIAEDAPGEETLAIEEMASQEAQGEVSPEGIVELDFLDTASDGEDAFELEGPFDTEESLEPLESPEALDVSELYGEEDVNADKPLTLGVKQTYALDTKKLGKKLTFKSSKPKIASVDGKGVITAKKKGSAVITCKNGKKQVGKWEVKVVAAPKQVKTVKSLTLGVKEKVVLKPWIPDGSATTFKWTTKDKKIAAVDQEGRITGKKKGKTTVTVTTHNGKKASVTVTVKAAPKEVKLNKNKATLEPGDTLKLKATLPKDTASGIMWNSSNKKVATVDGYGVVTAVGTGKVNITATTFNKKKATCVVTVKTSADDDFQMSDGVVTGYTGKGGDIVVPAEDHDGHAITAIGDGAFSGCTGLTSISFPLTLVTIGNSAFNGCTGITNIEVPNSVNYIGQVEVTQDHTGLRLLERTRIMQATIGYWIPGTEGSVKYRLLRWMEKSGFLNIDQRVI